MGNIVVLGTQWGDEGKGKIVDLLTPSFDIVARYQGGHNAGHTVYVDGKKIVLHLLPSGILHPGKLCLIGNGVVLSPPAFLEEVEALRSFGVSVDRNILISKGAHLILPYHSLVEKISEEMRGERKIGTTCRGIGPCYEDKAGRKGIRAADLLDLSVLREKIRENVEDKNRILKLFSKPLLEAEDVCKEYAGYAERLAPYIVDVSYVLDRRMKEGKTVLFEGAQGALLDIDHGTYPYVTSSNATVGGVCSGLGIGPDKIDGVLGIAKAYTTRVGGGPFPTEIFDERGEAILKKGDEFGATTGRARRCGWFDAVAVAYACRINGIRSLALTKPDVLDAFPDIPVCVEYTYKGTPLSNYPVESWVLEKVEPRFKILPGWKESLAGASSFSTLPGPFRDYVKFVEDLVQAEVCIVSTGFQRKETVLVDDKLRELAAVEKVRSALRG